MTEQMREIVAMEKINQFIGAFEPEAKRRILQWVTEAHGLCGWPLRVKPKPVQEMNG